ncbi:unnamed protein product [Schistosoma intercalatum]|nr:unnamed protein product [Schistosoma intercalatum]CAH8577210.1 unnamed protein product [Schistosoma intercalatum]
MPQIAIDGVEIDFPYQPYDCQIEYMTKVLLSLNEGKHAILESPTGTGKTLCLLCASLAWLDKQANSVQSITNAKHQNTMGKRPTSDNVDNTLSHQNFLASLGKVNNGCKIIFASRTHSQLAQAINALKGTVYSRHSVSVVGSRDQLCLLPDVASLESNSAKIYACRMRVQTRTCEYFRNFDSKRDDILTNLKSEGIVDIEDLSNYGQKIKCCPYFISRELKTDSSLIFMPYNYVLDPRIRSLYNINLENTTVIFDEAHNIEQVCEDASSVTLSSALLASAIEHVKCVCEVVFDHTKEHQEIELSGSNCNMNQNSEQKLSVIMNRKGLFDMTHPEENAIEALSIEKMITLKGQLIELERLIDELNVPPEGLTKDGAFIFDLLSRAGINHWTNNTLQTVIDEIMSFTNSTHNVKIRKTKGLHEVSEFLKTVFGYLPGEANVSFNFKTHFKLQHNDSISCYRLHIKDDILSANNCNKYGKTAWDMQPNTTTTVGAANRTISYWCFSPGRAIQKLIQQNVRCIILTSGTLYPIEPIEAELNLKFPISLRNPHVINPDQLNLSIIPRGPDGEKLNATYSVRETSAYRNSLGLLLIQLAEVVPAGLLIFFPSYAFMSQCIEFWKNGDIYEKLSQFKHIFIEPREKSQFNKIFNEYRKTACIENSIGAILFAVMRGRVSEGLDLADNAGRGVAILGIPYAPIHDPRVLLKMSYLDEQFVKLKSNSTNDQQQKTLIDKYPTGRQWYNLQAWRAINQAVGRVIRHYKDYGIIYLCDERFASNNAQMNLAGWMQTKCKIYNKVELVVKDTYEFFCNMRNKYPSIDRPVDTTLIVNNMLTEKSSLRSVNRTQPSLERSNLISNLPSAFELNIFSPNVNDSVTLITSYHSDHSPCSSKLHECNVDFKIDSISSSASIFDTVYIESENKDQNKYISDSNSYSGDLLEQKLLQRKPCKRIKLLEQKNNSIELSENVSSTTIVNNDNSLSSKYMTLLKSFLKSNGTNESVYASRLNDFKQVMKEYRQAITLNQNTLINQSNQLVEVLFTQLSRIFIPLEAPGLLQDAICFILPEHRKRYAELCHNLTGLPIIQSNSIKRPVDTSNQVSRSLATNSNQPVKLENIPEVSMKCCKCSADPAQVPVISCCKHIACFKCWRHIIDKGDHQCPVCRKLLRRRDLSRLIQKKDTEQNL